MPRSPSPGRYAPRGGRYRDPSPRRFDDRDRDRDRDRSFRDRRFVRGGDRDRDRDWDRNRDRTWDNYHRLRDRDSFPRDRERDRERERDRGWGAGGRNRGRSISRSRSRSRSRSVSKSRDRSPTTSRSRSPSKTRPNQPDGRDPSSKGPSHSQSKDSISASPEEGQIESPPPPSRRSPGVAWRRSPSPRRFGRGYGREGGRDDPGWGAHRERERERERERGREMDRDRDRTRARDFRDLDRDGGRGFPHSPRRSRSPSSASTHSRSRFSSPDKRRPSPSRSRLSPSYSGLDDRDKVTDRLVPPFDGLSKPSGPSQAGIQADPSHRTPVLSRPPPSGPRSERFPFSPFIPTGPRALSSSIPPAAPARLHPAQETKDEPASVLEKPVVGASNPYSMPVATPPAGPRLSWSNRKKQSPIGSPVGVATTSSTIVSTHIDKAAVTAEVSAVSIKQESTVDVHMSTSVKAEADIKPVINPYAASRSTTSGFGVLPVPPRTSGPAHPLAGDVERKPSTPPVPGTPSVVAAVVEERKLTESELAEAKARVEEARIMTELPKVKVSFGGATWQGELEKHHAAMSTLHSATLRAQSAYRLAAAVLADADTERVAAGERRKITEGQLMAGSFGMGLVSGV